ncbi:hypothetical protein CNBI0110 [Cryptococcus deneoformans B-3501A]|uniref:Uncharacterized protein n=1 Tax=Cryptococcus deneoformans (strain JEC21 / ATCC MYA-565) TaxID=214684 RepID=Q5K869_CRYD1|nr:hypothetical protein CNL06750 [Cryptococcus neoformans var. neoformans JEC21]XP_773645.1 hypothetical protein CNBI0110 [Cryptococcus neoformans var. neoformans B-3501A]AAW46677.2 hypothetical protein CNL06750 [Cryptococcus neoformans var. neoformans JEC21]EAL18998.1 hypothetical protein CNBI0110 [Cryptococcus neoformans var. neoformans B-3501A]
MNTMNLSHKSFRSLSSSSDNSAISTTSTSSRSSTHSRAWEDMIDRLASHKINARFDLWSGGNIRLNGLDLTLTTRDAEGLFKAMKTDDRFQIIHHVFFDEEKEDWKVSFIRAQPSPCSAFPSDSE